MMARPETSWMEEAACKGADTQIFFPSKGQKATEAQRYCRSCLVRAECLDYAFSNESAGGYHHYGIYGGLGPAERKRLTVLRKKKLYAVPDSTVPRRPDGAGTVPVRRPA